MNISIHHSEEICNSLKKNNLYENFTEYSLRYTEPILLAMFSGVYHGKTINFAEYSDYHRTSISRFLKSEHWNEIQLESAVKRNAIGIVYGESICSGKPVFCIVDDTISICKSKQSD